jgi:hypothetical protein
MAVPSQNITRRCGVPPLANIHCSHAEIGGFGTVSIILGKLLQGERTVNMTGLDCESIVEYVVEVYRKLATSSEANAMSSVKPNGLGALLPEDYSLRLGMPELPESRGTMGSIFGNGFAEYVPPPLPSLSNALAEFLSLAPPALSGDVVNMLSTPRLSEPTNALANTLTNPRPWYTNAPLTLADALPKVETKRKAYFAFRFEDIMRVNNVRTTWCIDHPNKQDMRSFYDRSLWGKSKAREPESLKALMRGAITHSSAVCVLVGTSTWLGRWVKYEIARSVVDERGLLAVHINNLNHHERKRPDTKGNNPLHWMGVYHSPNGNYYLYEDMLQLDARSSTKSWSWKPYEDFKDPVPLPKYIPSIPVGQVMPLARCTGEYDYYPATGRKDIGVWIDQAAAAVGR